MQRMTRPAASDYARIERAIRFVHANAARQPSLEEVAAELGQSAFHVQRLFQRWAGVSPKRFLQAVTVARARELLAQQTTVLETALAVGLSGPSRLHDHFLAVERMTPGEFLRQADGVTIRWDARQTQLGEALFAATSRGLCALTFTDGEPQAALLALQARWPGAVLRRDPRALAPYAETLNARLGGAPRPLGLVLKGTPLQLRVWEALLRIPAGQVVSYGALAQAVGAPGAARAVGSAVGQNPIGVLVPCHRVIQSTGALGGYRWGLPRKLALLGRERVSARPAAAR
jgi:AraC family transcriptional regulator of adaptative response/methylated-DNA-[protein]-cysteine methyltransferase